MNVGTILRRLIAAAEAFRRDLHADYRHASPESEAELEAALVLAKATLGTEAKRE